MSRNQIMSGMKKLSMMKTDGTREKVSHCLKSPENYSAQVKNMTPEVKCRKRKANTLQDSDKPNIIIEMEDTLSFPEDFDLRICELPCAAKKKKHADIEKEILQKKIKCESICSVEEEKNRTDTLTDIESYTESSQSNSNGIAEKSKPAEKPASQDSHMSWEDAEEEKQIRGWAIRFKNFFWRLINMPLTKVISIYETSVKCEFRELREMCIESLAASLSTSDICDVIVFAIENEEKKLQDCASDFFVKHAKEILDTEEFNSFLAKHTAVATELIKRAIK